jgi:NADPH:quinone reductase-like Zn-dependent oxidoreductase
MMKAMATEKAGLESLKVHELPDPEAAAGEVRVRVRHAAINPADAKVLQGELVGRILHGKQSPVVVGYDYCGVIDQVGPGTSGWKVGDLVCGFLPYSRSTRRGCFAERVVVRGEHCAQVPEGLDPRVAAALPTGGVTAIQCLRDIGRLQAGGSVLIVGAAGGVGCFAVGTAHRLGAKVTAVCSTPAIELVRSLGADEVIDRSTEDPLARKASYDVILDAAAA